MGPPPIEVMEAGPSVGATPRLGVTQLSGKEPKMADNRGLMGRWEDYRASKTVLFWSCTACVVVTLIVGFSWGGWVTGSTAGTMASKAAAGARAELAATICVNRFVSAPDAATALASLKNSDSWKRDDFIKDGG